MPRFTGQNQGKGNNCKVTGQGRGQGAGQGRGRGLCRSSAMGQQYTTNTNAYDTSNTPLKRPCSQNGKGQGRALRNQDNVSTNIQK